MQFKDLAVGESFTKTDSNAVYTKVPENRTCCKVKWNAQRLTDNEHVVLRPTDEVTKVEK